MAYLEMADEILLNLSESDLSSRQEAVFWSWTVVRCEWVIQPKLQCWTGKAAASKLTNAASLSHSGDWSKVFPVGLSTLSSQQCILRSQHPLSQLSRLHCILCYQHPFLLLCLMLCIILSPHPIYLLTLQQCILLSQHNQSTLMLHLLLCFLTSPSLPCTFRINLKHFPWHIVTAPSDNMSIAQSTIRLADSFTCPLTGKHSHKIHYIFPTHQLHSHTDFIIALSVSVTIPNSVSFTHHASQLHNTVPI